MVAVNAISTPIIADRGRLGLDDTTTILESIIAKGYPIRTGDPSGGGTDGVPRLVRTVVLGIGTDGTSVHSEPVAETGQARVEAEGPEIALSLHGERPDHASAEIDGQFRDDGTGRLQREDPTAVGVQPHHGETSRAVGSDGRPR
jgi:hypothetical protein